MKQKRQTKQRDSVRDAFEQLSRPLSPTEIFDYVKTKVPGFGMATVYRSIKHLMEEGAIVSVALSGEPDRYELAGKHHHHHFRCTECRRVYELEGCLHGVQELVPPGFSMRDHEITLSGVCAACGVG